MKHIIKYDISPELARKAATKAAERYTEKFSDYDVKTVWNTENNAVISFRVKGLDVSATMDLEPNQVSLDMQVPFILRPFKKKALHVVKEVIRKWIGKARNGELD